MALKRIFFACGPGNIIQAHHCWKRGEHEPTQVSVTFSSQIEEFCQEIQAKIYFVATYPQKAILTDGDFTFEHRPKPTRQGAWYHITQVVYGLGLLSTALRFRAQVALIDSGISHWFVVSLFRVFGIRVVPVLHNTLWPAGFPPSKPIPRLVHKLDSWLFWRWIPSAVIGVSPECERQVLKVRGKARYPMFQIRAQFVREYFARIPPPPPHEQRPFRIMFIGRIDRIKGVFDILHIARKLEDTHPGLVCWDVCGGGKDLDELTQRHQELALSGVVNVRGWTSLDDLIGVYADCHASIVPTRSSFEEGLAMTAAEAILAGRPVVTNPVVPALEVLRGACVPAKTNDAESHAMAVLQLATDADLYRRACVACSDYQNQFYDRANGLAAVLRQALLGETVPRFD
jgi:glycosyltransferase involved in cell wall biosynthesis